MTGQPGALWLAVYYGAVAAAYLVYRYLIFRKKKREAENADGRSRIEEPGLLRTPGIFLLGFAAVMLFVCRAGHEHQGGVQVTVLDVGQGDCACIQQGKDVCYIIDGGSSTISRAGQYRILPFLKEQGIRTVDGIFVSHMDEDHVNGILEILEMIKERNSQLDIAKGLGMTIVVLFHAQILSGVWTQFHMPLFAFLSGLLYREKYNTELNQVWNYTKKKIKDN